MIGDLDGDRSERKEVGDDMGFEFWLNGVKYDYASLKTVSISVDKHDLEHGDMFEHTVIKIETRSKGVEQPLFPQELVEWLELSDNCNHQNKDGECHHPDSTNEICYRDTCPIKKPSGVESGESETGVSGEPATPAEELSGVLKHSPSKTPEGNKYPVYRIIYRGKRFYLERHICDGCMKEAVK